MILGHVRWCSPERSLYVKNPFLRVRRCGGRTRSDVLAVRIPDTDVTLRGNIADDVIGVDATRSADFAAVVSGPSRAVVVYAD
jgi:hypothetical protein